MKIHLLVYDDGFERKVERASFDGLKMSQMEEELNGPNGAIGPYFSYSVDVEDLPVDNNSLKTVELAIAANGGEAFKKGWCHCDPSVGLMPCEYCAIRNALLESKRILIECFDLKKNEERKEGSELDIYERIFGLEQPKIT